MSWPHFQTPIPSMAYTQASLPTVYQAQTPAPAQAQGPALAQAQAPMPATTSAPSPAFAFSVFPAQAPAQVQAQAPVQASTSAPSPAIALTGFPAQAPAPGSAVAPPSSSRQPEHLMHKNRLQEITHKLNIPLPIYQTVNEGFQHAPQFRATVLVDGVKYTSPNTFSTRKAAEKDVAELALRYISQKKPDEGFPQGFPEALPLIHEDTVFCKSILNEFATKMNIEMPAYNTIKPEGLLPVFISSLVFNGVSYTGGAGKNKKEAEQLAARAVILSLLGDSKMRKVLYDIIKSKVKLYAALHKVDNGSTIPLMTNTTNCSAVVPSKDVGVEAIVPTTSIALTSTNSLPTIVDNVATGASNGYSRNGTLKHEFNIQKQENSFGTSNLPEPATQAPKLPIEFVAPTSTVTMEIGPSSSKKRRKNKKKANKRLCTGTQLPMTTVPVNQAPPCSVAQ